MMWAATVRRCPSGHSRHPSQFGARLQLARALNHAPYLICDGVYNCPPSIRPQIREDLELNRQDFQPWPQEIRILRSDSFENNEEPYMPRASPVQLPDRDDVRVQLPYSRREASANEQYPPREHIIRRYEDLPTNVADDAEDDSVVGLSYQQRSLGAPYGGDLWNSELAMDCWGDRPLLLKRSMSREIVKTLSVVGVSLTLIICVVMAFGVQNFLVTGLFLALLLTTVSLGLFLMMRKPTCFACCRDTMEIPPPDPNQTDFSSYLTEVHSNVVKKKPTDSPPPYESPPDYNSLPPELLVTPRGLSDFDAPPADVIVPIHYGDHYTKPNPRIRRSVLGSFSKKRTCPQRSHIISQTSPLISQRKPQSSTRHCSTPDKLEPCKVSGDPEQENIPPPPPSYDCVVKITEETKELKRH